MTDKPACGNCACFRGGTCRLNPPTMVLWPNQALMQTYIGPQPITYLPVKTWPGVAPDDHCFQWRRKQ